jgi:hypothetical protein
MWRPTSPSLFPNPKLPTSSASETTSNTTASNTTTTATTTTTIATREKYRHPHYRGDNLTNTNQRSSRGHEEGPRIYSSHGSRSGTSHISSQLPVGYVPVETHNQPKKVFTFVSHIHTKHIKHTH